MSDLIEFLQARLAEQSKTVALLRTLAAVLHENARPVLADVASQLQRDADAKRRILDEHQPGHPGPGGRPGCAVCDIGARSCGCMGSGHYPCLTVRLLALPYASHPEYRKEWRP